MDHYVTANVIRELREKKHMTQMELAERLHVSDKTVSKWENGKGYPDITLLQPIADVFHISVSELLAGTAVQNTNVSGNMRRSHFYICPLCSNVLFSMGEAMISCHGITLKPEPMEQDDEEHMMFIERIEDEYYVRVDHAMTKSHYISFIAGIGNDHMEMVKLYPEGPAEARLRIAGTKRIVCYCNRDGMFCIDPVKGLDDRTAYYQDMKERRELEEAGSALVQKKML